MNALSRRRFLSASAAFAAGTFANRFGFAAEPRIDAAKLVSGNTAFGCELYGELKAEAGNLFFSPFSISTALGMAAAGAKGMTPAMFAELMAVVALANGNNRLANGYRIEVDPRYRKE